MRKLFAILANWVGVHAQNYDNSHTKNYNNIVNTNLKSTDNKPGTRRVPLIDLNTYLKSDAEASISKLSMAFSM